jgi:hypothetical protein
VQRAIITIGTTINGALDDPLPEIRYPFVVAWILDVWDPA